MHDLLCIYSIPVHSNSFPWLIHKTMLLIKQQLHNNNYLFCTKKDPKWGGLNKCVFVNLFCKFCHKMLLLFLCKAFLSPSLSLFLPLSSIYRFNSNKPQTYDGLTNRWNSCCVTKMINVIFMLFLGKLVAFYFDTIRHDSQCSTRKQQHSFIIYIVSFFGHFSSNSFFLLVSFYVYCVCMYACVRVETELPQRMSPILYVET